MNCQVDNHHLSKHNVVVVIFFFFWLLLVHTKSHPIEVFARNILFDSRIYWIFSCCIHQRNLLERSKILLPKWKEWKQNIRMDEKRTYLEKWQHMSHSPAEKPNGRCCPVYINQRKSNRKKNTNTEKGRNVCRDNVILAWLPNGIL